MKTTTKGSRPSAEERRFKSPIWIRIASATRMAKKSAAMPPLSGT
jgi:hypothetical protein